jgi:hypothetical protein
VKQWQMSPMPCQLLLSHQQVKQRHTPIAQLMRMGIRAAPVKPTKGLAMASGVEIRAEIDTENVKGLLLINGGGAVALLAFLPAVLGKHEYVPLAKAVLFALLLFQFGLLAAVIHNRLRRVCSLVYEQAQAYSPAHPNPCVFLGKTLSEPCVCMASIAFMWLSAFLFFAAGIIVFVGGMLVVC